ncbi:tryptophan biosynthesis modulator TrpM [Streptomyces angustmyceticus]|uniref:tryptophan biosynthesis modulator TrpM n=1 Tax=Streptomyces angustmyceticus TaxID=285578 RepID=UPI0012604102
MTATAARLSCQVRVPHPGPAGARPAAEAGRVPAPGPVRGVPSADRHHPAPQRCALPPWHRGCRAPARRVHGRRVRYHIGSEPGQINGRRWRPGPAR